MLPRCQNLEFRIQKILLNVISSGVERFVFCFLFFGASVYGQCAMCRASLESSGNTTQAEAVNDGIVFLMAIPYILVATLGFIIYRLFNKKKG